MSWKIIIININMRRLEWSMLFSIIQAFLLHKVVTSEAVAV